MSFEPPKSGDAPIASNAVRAAILILVCCFGKIRAYQSGDKHGQPGGPPNAVTFEGAVDDIAQV
jgi:hypothetical protein